MFYFNFTQEVRTKQINIFSVCVQAAYTLWAERQQANAARDIANQNRIQANIPQGNAGPAQNRIRCQDKIYKPIKFQ